MVSEVGFTGGSRAEQLCGWEAADIGEKAGPLLAKEFGLYLVGKWQKNGEIKMREYLN